MFGGGVPDLRAAMTETKSAHPVPEEEAETKELIVYTRLCYVLLE